MFLGDFGVCWEFLEILEDVFFNWNKKINYSIRPRRKVKKP
jgi:hypothetical protein